MKFIIALACFVLFVAVIQSFPGKKMRAIYKKCCDENNATMANVMATYFDREVPSEREILCALGCINIESGFLLPNLTLNGTMYKWVLMHVNHQPEENATKIVEICTDALTGITDKCDAAGALIKCNLDNLPEED